jgi:hypothetical protein
MANISNQPCPIAGFDADAHFGRIAQHFVLIIFVLQIEEFEARRGNPRAWGRLALAAAHAL